ncbi:hypothetical protein BDFB_012490 [Asbolus verrucosus]|uniref:DDE 3 domain containing protein n=1 Tax=Asbolus verrucosus TaxID=1661398 RepID=A0A482V887_ASBVE|nr:hypothetical protein BDFB_012490 [Asbolus verrucosus]
MNLACAIVRHIHHTIGIMVWGAITHGSRSPLHVVRGTMTAVRYVNEVLRPIVVPYVRGIEDSFSTKQNSNHTLLDLPRKASTQRCYRSLLDHLICHLSKKHGIRWVFIFMDLPHPPTNLQELQRAVVTPQEFINKAIESMPRNVQDCIAERDSSTHY